MKKENKKLAQERRAKQRRKAKVLKIVKPVLMYGIPSILFIALVAVIILNPFWEKWGNNEEETAVESEVVEETKLLTDKELEVKDGDTVNIDYVGSIDGVEFDGGNTGGTGTDLLIGSGTYIDDFEEQLIGTHPGDEVDVVVTFPEDYGFEELNGKEAVFKVVVNGIYE